MAQASGIPEYEEAPEEISVPKHHTKDPVAHAQNAGNGGEVAPQGETGGTGPAEGGSEESSAGGNPGTGGNGGSGKGGQGNGAPGGAQAAPNQAQAENLGAETDSDSGGSSPLVPILIAIAALAAISVGAVVIRQRRQRRAASGGTVSPKVS